MSILIKGEIPKNCLYCRFCVDNEERMCTVCTALNKDFDNGIIVYENRRRDDCPLIELSPHGRLIDADALHIQLIDKELDQLQPWISFDDYREVVQIEDGMDSFIKILKD